jgi:hypothetical protein
VEGAASTATLSRMGPAGGVGVGGLLAAAATCAGLTAFDRIDLTRKPIATPFRVSGPAKQRHASGTRAYTHTHGARTRGCNRKRSIRKGR